MSRECVLEIQDEVNVRFVGLDVETRRQLADKLKFFLEYARHTPAFKLGRWDGMMRFCDIGGRSYLNLIDQLLPIVQSAGYSIVIDDKRKPHKFEFDNLDVNRFAHVCWPAGHVCAGEPMILRDHQVEAANLYLQNLQCMQEISTGAGKTVISALMAVSVEKYGRTITIVPSKDLVTQTERDFKLLGLDTGVYFGDRKETGRTHTICTWQAMEALDKKSKRYDPEFDIDEFARDVIAIICDEAHTVTATVLQKHLSTTFADVPIRWGMTGTVPLEVANKTALIAVLGPVINEVSAAELQEKGLLSKLDIEILQIQDNMTDFGSYPAEVKFLSSNHERLRLLADEIIKAADTDGNTLVLIDRIATGEILMEMIPGAVFISGVVKSDKRKAEYKDIQDSDNRIVIATFGVASTGIDLPRLFNVFLVEPGKSFVRVIQSIGRGIRVAKDKNYVKIYDICSNAKYSKRHLTERKKYYKQKEYPFKVVKKCMK